MGGGLGITVHLCQTYLARRNSLASGWSSAFCGEVIIEVDLGLPLRDSKQVWQWLLATEEHRWTTPF